MEKTNSPEDRPLTDYEILEKAIKRSQRWAGLSLGGVFLLIPAVFFLTLLSYSLKDPVIINNVSYVTDDGRVITEEASESVPTINDSVRFVQQCLRNTLNVTSAQYQQELEVTRYCYDRNTYLSNFSMIGDLIQRQFIDNRIQGGYIVKNVEVTFSHDLNSVVREAGCNEQHLEIFEFATGCRTFKVELDMEAINFSNGKRAPMPYKGRVDLLIGDRQSLENGMQIIWSDNVAQGV